MRSKRIRSAVRPYKHTPLFTVLARKNPLRVAGVAGVQERRAEKNRASPVCDPKMSVAKLVVAFRWGDLDATDVAARRVQTILKDGFDVLQLCAVPRAMPTGRGSV